jgi:glycerol uptake facilitator-like aquaporin
VAQVIGGVAGAATLCVIATGQVGFDAAAGFASNGFGEHSPVGYSMMAALVTEVVMTFMVLMIILARIIHEHADQTPRTTGTAGLLVPAGTLQILASSTILQGRLRGQVSA